MSPVAVSADRRFHRAHVKPARKRGVVRTVAIATLKYGLLLTLFGAAAVQTTTFLSTSPTLQISTIQPIGTERVSPDAVVGLLAGLRGENILRADLDVWRSKLLESPWIREATFRRSLPSTIQVLVQERTPIAVGRMNGRLFLVDERGATIDEYGPQYASLDLPIVDGFSEKGADKDGDASRGAMAARLIMALRQKPTVASRLSQVDVTNLHNVTILLNNDTAELRVGDDHFLARVESYLSLSDALRQRVPEIDYVDLRFDGRVYVRPLGQPGKGGVARAVLPTVSRPDDVDPH